MQTAPPESPPDTAAAAAASPAPVESTSNFPAALTVQVGVVATILIFAACATLIIMRSATVDVPNAMLVVRAPPAWEGTVAYVDGINLARPQSGPIERKNNYMITFHLVPGEYSFTVRKDLGIVYTGDFKLTDRDRIRTVHLPETPTSVESASTQPTWQSGGDFDSMRWGR